MPRRIALVMAGGGGTRLWPASTDERPKQLLDPLLHGHGETLVSQTVARLSGLVAPHDVWVVVGDDQLAGVRAALPDVPATNFVVEPARRNTAPCIALSLAFVRQALGDAAQDTTLLVLPADHHVLHPDRFCALVHTACVHAEASQSIVTLGIEPDHPATGFGYLHRTAAHVPAVVGDNDTPVFSALRFVEKPDAATAGEFVRSGDYLWNAGIFVMTVPRIEAELLQHCRPTWDALQPVREALAHGEDPGPATRVAYEAIAPAAIDVAVMEKLTDLRVIPASVGWTDLGSWRSIHSIGRSLARTDAADNVCIAADGARAVVIHGSDNLVWSEDATVGLIGVHGLAVVVSGGRVLVCPIDRTEEVKALLLALDQGPS